MQSMCCHSGTLWLIPQDFKFSITHMDIYRIGKYAFSMRSTRQTKKTIRHTLDGDSAFAEVELVRFMDKALVSPCKKYVIKVNLERWTDRACKHWEGIIHKEPHWKNLNFKY